MGQTTEFKLPHYHVTAGLIHHNGKILITQRQFNDAFGGLWEFPGGKQQPNETLEQCLVREIAEELDLPIRVGQKLMKVSHQYDQLKITLHVFWCTCLHDHPQSRGVAAWRWVEISDLGQFQFTAADLKVIAKLKRLQGKISQLQAD
ncbi:MAG: (deoxy)nucleoside triphosphate pyrophosphohydrolase [candidate division KSB1 bacterium]|nr:(deoxy)nucleoside triphosphate pyrophosphohydrolase [candidate division KSB1 bacterium]MDZ7402017.1 (deoxy)nucleoside triphosphate pyrophosphohydrolase [candidate division KSB1 bacterium]